MTHLERSVSRALYVATRVEKMLHDNGPWTITWGPHEVPASRTIEDDQITFSASIPEVCWIVRPTGGIELRCNGEVVAIQHIEDPGDGPFSVTIAYGAKIHAERV